jgi:hypothetical protein
VGASPPGSRAASVLSYHTIDGRHREVVGGPGQNADGMAPEQAENGENDDQGEKVPSPKSLSGL